MQAICSFERAHNECLFLLSASCLAADQTQDDSPYEKPTGVVNWDCRLLFFTSDKKGWWVQKCV